MKYTPDFVITFKEEEGRTVPLLWKTWAIKNFCIEHGFKVDEMIGKYEATQIDEIMAIGHKCYCMYNDLPVPEVSEKESCDWIDELGGYNSPKTYEMLEVFMAKALGLTVKELRERIEAAKVTPKEKETESPNASGGASTKKSVPKPA